MYKVYLMIFIPLAIITSVGYSYFYSDGMDKAADSIIEEHQN